VSLALTRFTVVEVSTTLLLCNRRIKGSREGGCVCDVFHHLQRRTPLIMGLPFEEPGEEPLWPKQWVLWALLSYGGLPLQRTKMLLNEY
jgi:hypothetical protein